MEKYCISNDGCLTLTELPSRDTLCDCATTANCHLAWILRLMMESAIFWLVTLCSSGRGWRFGGIQRLRLQGRTVRQRRNQQKQAGSWENPDSPFLQQAIPSPSCLCSCLVSFIIVPWRWRGNMFLRNVRLSPNHMALQPWRMNRWESPAWEHNTQNTILFLPSQKFADRTRNAIE